MTYFTLRSAISGNFQPTRRRAESHNRKGFSRPARAQAYLLASGLQRD